MSAKTPIKLLALILGALCLSAGLVEGKTATSDEPREAQGAALDGPAGVDHLQTPAGSSLGASASASPRKPGVVLSCAVVKWTPTRHKPILALACPAWEAEASARVYIKLSWMEPGDRPDDYQSIFAPPSTPAMFRSNDEGAFVWLTVRPGGREKPRAAWISFNELGSLEVQGQEQSKE